MSDLAEVVYGSDGRASWVAFTRDDATRTATTFDPAGEVIAVRPYTSDEDAAADERDREESVRLAIVALDRAVALSAAPEELVALQLLNLPPDGSPWVQPLGAHDAYPLPSTVTHDGKTWDNLTPANVWEPGVFGWREVDAGGGLPEWVEPLGSEDAYSFGDEVAHLGHKWTSVNPGEHTNVWEPGVFGWEDDGPLT